MLSYRLWKQSLGAVSSNHCGHKFGPYLMASEDNSIQAGSKDLYLRHSTSHWDCMVSGTVTDSLLLVYLTSLPKSRGITLLRRMEDN